MFVTRSWRRLAAALLSVVFGSVFAIAGCESEEYGGWNDYTHEVTATPEKGAVGTSTTFVLRLNDRLDLAYTTCHFSLAGSLANAATANVTEVDVPRKGNTCELSVDWKSEAEGLITAFLLVPNSKGTIGQQTLGYAVGPAIEPKDAGPDGPLTRGCAKGLDLVFVVDNSGSMAEEQKNLAANFPKFVNALDAFKDKNGNTLDYRIAVTTTDTTAATDRGAFRIGAGKDAGCNAGPERRWLERGDPDVAGAFACRALVGTSGSTIERPLEALRLALEDRMDDGTNKPFLRPDAVLAFVILTDEDEGGTEAEPAMEATFYLGIFDSLKGGERKRWATTVIAGPGTATCSSPGFGNASPALRLQLFVKTSGENARFTSICAGDLTPGLSQMLEGIATACNAR